MRILLGSREAAGPFLRAVDGNIGAAVLALNGLDLLGAPTGKCAFYYLLNVQS